MPLARSEQLIIEELEDEVLVYDQSTDLAHCLSPTAARVWRACDGYTMTDALANKLGLDDATVARTLEELESCSLFEAGTGPSAGSTRRELTIRMAKVGGVVAATPLIYSIAAPTPALAASEKFCLALGCTQDCGICHQNKCSCCGPGNKTTSADKICTADCSSINCNDTIRSGHCGTVSPSNACN